MSLGEFLQLPGPMRRSVLQALNEQIDRINEAGADANKPHRER